MLQEIKLKVNGSLRVVRVDEETPLLYVLRNDLGLKGAKYGCGEEQCGACKVIIDGEAVPSCRIPARSVQGKEIFTIEGISPPNSLHAVQRAFIEEDAAQCGFCVPGIIMSGVALLDKNPNPTLGEIKAALAYNLCRCGIHERAMRVIQRAAGQQINPSTYELHSTLLKPLHEPVAKEFPMPFRDAPQIDAWIRINEDETITVFTGKVEYGQGIKTAFAQIAAEELDVALERIHVVMADTAQTPDEGITAGSRSLETSGNAIRYAAAEARAVMFHQAGEELGAPPGRLSITDGMLIDPATGRSTTYWKLFGGKRFNRPVMEDVKPKPAEKYQVVGKSVQRLDLFTKVTGGAWYVQDMELADMVHARVVRPPAYAARLLSANEKMVTGMPGVLKVVRDGSFLAVIASQEDQAIRAMFALKQGSVWENPDALPSQDDFVEYMLRQPAQSFRVVDGTPVEGPVPPIQAPADAAQTIQATYFRPYQMHASIGPSAAVALMSDGKLTIWSHTQGPYPLRAAIAHDLGMPESDVRVIHMEGPGCYGHNGADDVALDAALLANSVPGRAVSVKWMRFDEHAWEPYGPAMLFKLQASLDEQGQVIDWNHDVWSYTHLGRARPVGSYSGLVASWQRAEPMQYPTPQPAMWDNVGEHRNADPYYSFPKRRIAKHFIAKSPLRTSSLRSLGGMANVFAVESFVDEVAHTAGMDPLEFRLQYLEDERARAVLQVAAEKAGWEKGLQKEGYGRGVSFARYKNHACYVAAVAEVSVNRDSGQIAVERVLIAADAGQIVNPDGLSNQLQGAFLQGTSLALKEKVGFDPHGVNTLNWFSYPILRFTDVPQVEVVLINRPGAPYLGAGEGGIVVAPSAIANAIYDAVGIRLRSMPFTPERVREAIKDQLE